jgi:phosphate starvation-inducible PhoH-like protein
VSSDGVDNFPLNAAITTRHLTLEPNDARRLALVCGQLDAHLQQIITVLKVDIRSRGNLFQISGPEPSAQAAAEILSSLYRLTGDGETITPELIHLLLREARVPEPADIVLAEVDRDDGDEFVIRTRKGGIKPRGKHQREYVRSIFRHDINFGIGPAGTGKTYLAVACAVDALEQDQVRRILLVRPAVEAGEKLGFLPGDLAEKINPYLRPLYDALYEMMGFERVAKLIERQVIEVCPLAYMRGRTLNNAFIILDESQNTTREQMKMFLTRIGFGSKAVITGDQTQVDLPRGTQSGLVHAINVLNGIPGIGFTHFDSKDVVRHQLVQRIVEAYESFERTDSRHSSRKDTD